MNTVHSAGGIVARRMKDNWEVLLIRDMNQNWTFPKGLIEKGEDPRSAAIREIQEETGLSGITYMSSLRSVFYTFKQEDMLVHKKVTYYLFRHEGIQTPVGRMEEGIDSVRWFNFQEAFSAIGYPKTNKPLLVLAKKILNA